MRFSCSLRAFFFRYLREVMKSWQWKLLHFSVPKRCGVAFLTFQMFLSKKKWCWGILQFFRKLSKAVFIYTWPLLKRSKIKRRIKFYRKFHVNYARTVHERYRKSDVSSSSMRNKSFKDPASLRSAGKTLNESQLRVLINCSWIEVAR